MQNAFPHTIFNVLIHRMVMKLLGYKNGSEI